MNLDLISAIIFYSLLGLFLVINIKKFEVQKILFPVFYAVLYRTKFGLKLMGKIADKFTRFLKYLAYIGIGVGYAGMVFIFILLIQIVATTFRTKIAMVQPVLPGIPIPGAPITIPFWYGIIAIFLAIVVHEGAHGVISLVHKLKLKSSGFGFFAIFLPIIPLAFVEPDEKKMEKRKTKEQLAIVAAGPFANILLVIALIFLFGLSFSLPAATGISVISENITSKTAILDLDKILQENYEIKGLEINKIEKDSPAEEAGMKQGVLIKEINGVDIKENMTGFLQVLFSLGPNEKIKFNTNDGEYEILTAENPENKTKGFIGISGIKVENVPKEEFKEKYGVFAFLPFILFNFVIWIIMLNFAIGLFNLLPLGPADGGRMFYLLMSKFMSKKNALKLTGVATWFCIILLLTALLFPYIYKLF